MDAERWREVERLYHSALEQQPGLRAAFLEEACGGDESLLRDVGSLLDQSQQTSRFLESPAMELAAQSLAESTSAAGHALPAVIGRYRIIRLLGEGGMGTVYEAEQEEPRRFVALKVIKLGSATPDRLRRFRRESQALARLQHSGIAQIYEAGIADAGIGPQPYFAMELIRGLPLREYAEAHRLTSRQKLLLMVKVCEAVHHAHQRGLIHRDLKPANILVDPAGQPKILDFGVARLTAVDAPEDASLATVETGLGQIVGTLAYMSPEQVLGDSLEIDTRSDIYSLGVILYEILSGRLPYEVSQRQLPEAVRTIRDEDPKPLSLISRNYRGDIETIAGKALAKERARRYSSAAELGADIQRYLHDEPIAARAPSAGYQLQKFIRRNRAPVMGLAAVFVVLAAGVVVSAFQAVRANRAGQAASKERDRAVAAEANAVRERNRALAETKRADGEAAVSKAVNEFLQNDLLAQAGSAAQAGPRTKPDPDLKVRIALDRAAAGIGRKFEKQPLVEASIRQTIGNAYHELGIYPEAQKHLEGALDLRRKLLGAEHPDTVSVMSDLTRLYRDAGKYAEAEPLARKVLEIQQRLLGDQHPETLDAMNALGLLYRYEGKAAQAEVLLSKVLEIRRRLSGEEDVATLFVMNSLGYVYEVEGKYQQAENLLSRVWLIRRRVSGQDHPYTLMAADNVATVYYRQRKYAQAEALWTKNLEIRSQVLGPDHPDTLDTMNNLGVVDRTEGKFAEALVLLNKVLDAKRRVLGEEHPSTQISMINVAVLYRDQGAYAKAEPLLVRGVELQSRVLSEEHPDRLAGITRLAALYSDEGKFPEADALFAKALGIQLRVLGAAHPDTLSSRTGLGQVQLREDKYSEAEATLREALKGYEIALPESWERFQCESLLGESLRGQEKYGAAEPLLLAGYAGLQKHAVKIPMENPRVLSQAGERILQLYESWSKPEQAAQWRQTLTQGRDATAGRAILPAAAF